MALPVRTEGFGIPQPLGTLHALAAARKTVPGGCEEGEFACSTNRREGTELKEMCSKSVTTLRNVHPNLPELVAKVVHSLTFPCTPLHLLHPNLPELVAKVVHSLTLPYTPVHPLHALTPPYTFATAVLPYAPLHPLHPLAPSPRRCSVSTASASGEG